MKKIPTVSEIHRVRRLVSTGLFSVSFIAHMTGVSLRGVFLIDKSLRKNVDQQSFC